MAKLPAVAGASAANSRMQVVLLARAKFVAGRAYAAEVSGGGRRRSQTFSVLVSGWGGVGSGASNGPSGTEVRPELADVGRLAKRLMQRTVSAARAEERSVGRLLADHLGGQHAELPVAKGAWAAYDRVNVQTGLDAWLAEPGRTHQLVGLTQFRHYDFGLADLLHGGERYSPGIGSVATEAVAAGPGGLTRPCVQCGIYLTVDADGPAALLLRGPEQHGMHEEVTVEVVCASRDRAPEVVESIRRLSLEHNVFRGHVISFGGEVFDHEGSGLLTFLDRPDVVRDQVILPAELLDGIERQVIGVARHAGRLRASGQHLRRGVLLYGVPGTGKTHTIRYLLGRLPGVTAVVLSGGALGMIAAACSVARALQPTIVVVEDVDLIAAERDHYAGESSLLFQLLNEMDGLGSDSDVTFLLTTNRADLLEPALAARPGRFDHAAELPVPDSAARARLLSLYQGRLDLVLADPDAVIARTEGVTASFIKELLRRGALIAADADNSASADSVAPIRVTDGHLNAALDELLDTRSALTQSLLGGGPARAPGTTAGA